MATSKNKIKLGMGGSRNGNSRYEYTEVLKKDSKKRRRRDDKKVVKDSL
jgi:hypothetical protein